MGCGGVGVEVGGAEDTEASSGNLGSPREASCSGFLPESLSSLPPALPSYKGPGSPVQITPLPPRPAPSSEGEARLPDAQLS